MLGIRPLIGEQAVTITYKGSTPVVGSGEFLFVN
jgi:hypothetical protein